MSSETGLQEDTTGKYLCAVDKKEFYHLLEQKRKAGYERGFQAGKDYVLAILNKKMEGKE